jgi:hypothetical protein
MSPLPATSSKSSVAQEIVSFCTRCKIDLAHMIVAMQGDRIIKVQCKTCKSFHSYRPSKGVTEASPKTARAPREKAVRTSVEDEWTRLMRENSAKPVRTYSPKTIYVVGDRIGHPTFGDGVVGKLLHPNKVEIVFQNDIKVLIHSLP